MSNKRALWKYKDYIEEISKCDYIIKKTKNWKTRNDFIKRKNRLKSELREYQFLRGIKNEN